VTRIGLIATGGTTTGNERYMLDLSEALLRREDDLQYSIYYTREAVRERIEARSPGPTFVKVHAESKLLRQTAALPLAIRRSPVGLLHSQYGLPAFTTTPAVVMLPDVYFARNPAHHPWMQRMQLAYRIPRALAAARRVIIPSVFSRDDVLDLYRVDETKIRIIPHGISDRFHPMPEADTEPVRRKYSLPGRFQLFVGALQPRKNLTRLVRAFGQLSRETRDAFPLIISGARRWMYRDLEEAARPFEEEGTLRFLGFTDDADLPALMNLATLFVFPSLSEGFGFPPLEAMRCGTCVLAADAGSLPELIRDGGLLVDPRDVAAIRDGMRTLLESADLRARLAARGRTVAEQYTWERTARETARVYLEALHEN
jgi:alpha-1,3-rhamnosyl/mannosyltransferase